MMSFLDVYKTSLSLAKSGASTNQGIDSLDVSCLFQHWDDVSCNPRTTMIYSCEQHALAARVGPYKLAWGIQKWILPDGSPTPEDVCHGECCPGTATSPAHLCLCDPDSLAWPDPPLLYDIERDIGENYVLTPDNFANYSQVRKEIEKIVSAYNASLGKLPERGLEDAPPIDALQPCCQKEPCAGICTCNYQLEVEVLNVKGQSNWSRSSPETSKLEKWTTKASKYYEEPMAKAVWGITTSLALAYGYRSLR
jgi:hypothetical protein